MGSLLLKVHFCLEFPFWLKLAAKNETHQALQNNVNRIITLSHARIHVRTHTGKQLCGTLFQLTD